jgi:hypothetical protein
LPLTIQAAAVRTFFGARFTQLDIDKQRLIARRGVGNILSSACGSWRDGRQYQFSETRIVALKGQLNTAAHGNT